MASTQRTTNTSTNNSATITSTPSNQANPNDGSRDQTTAQQDSTTTRRRQRSSQPQLPRTNFPLIDRHSWSTDHTFVTSIYIHYHTDTVQILDISSAAPNLYNLLHQIWESRPRDILTRNPETVLLVTASCSVLFKKRKASHSVKRGLTVALCTDNIVRVLR